MAVGWNWIDDRFDTCHAWLERRWLGRLAVITPLSFCATKQSNWWLHWYVYAISIWKLRWHFSWYFYLFISREQRTTIGVAEIRFSRFFLWYHGNGKSCWRYWWFCQVAN
jgi:hypothetical protein